jgi:hypothetical protein
MISRASERFALCEDGLPRRMRSPEPCAKAESERHRGGRNALLFAEALDVFF